MLLNPVLVLLGHCVASSLAQALFTASSYAGITVGQPFDLTWVNAVGLVSLNLVRDANHNDIVAPIAANVSGSSYLWTPPYAPAASEGPFAFEISSKRVMGEEHPNTLTSMSNLAFTWKSQGRADEALRLMKECFMLRKQKLGADHPDTLSSLAALHRWESASPAINS